MLPILAADAFLRQYISDRGRQWLVVRNVRGRRIVIDNTTRALLELCDGENDVTTIARLSGRILAEAISPMEIDHRLAPLLEAGCLIDAAKRVPGAVSQDPHRGLQIVRLDDEEVAAMKLVIPPNLGFDCDGKGSCCRLYDRIALSNEDAARIQALYAGEHTPGGLYPESALFLGRPGRNPMEYELAVVDGGCVMLNSEGWCDIHARFGKDQKPMPCSAYPMRDVYCEGELHVGISVECRCSIVYKDGPSILPLAEEVMARRRRLHMVEMVAKTIPATAEQAVPREEYLAWRVGAGERLARSRDVARWALNEAARVADGDLVDGGKHLRVLADAAQRIRQLLTAEVINIEEIYSANDYQRAHIKWGAQAASRLCELLSAQRLPEGPSLPPVDGERLCAEQTLYLHSGLRAVSLCVGLFALALRLWLARAGQRDPHPDPLMPVCAVEYLHRAYGVGAISDQLQVDIEACFLS